MNDEPARLAEGITPVQRDRSAVLGHFCEHQGCGKVGGWGFARRRQESHWFCFEHRGEGEGYL
ncbi:MAG: hypothetical protein E5V49_01215 [Mesorhizobium sp.]|nr:hypothetical protein EN848_23000 [bacterium M00.F.Ca.ET.205.01.1.1]TGU49439.1 hypothetical protein EN795_24280 [bacterium M00.F.Ca.ET.152.01.1.1]TGV33537.1 hypothetical protein EN829_022235 [Mesorhizobium sp. M00.F.Ca.ET.186.01.1.1]TGZ40440.1 hypothetical protein EN805_23675 [bacterium M00.F.Ca.ET.162.01.1.1]TIW63181.1 MAG: hypothetical protein E5V48_01605 [Mesorhizobium sp.]